MHALVPVSLVVSGLFFSVSIRRCRTVTTWPNTFLLSCPITCLDLEYTCDICNPTSKYNSSSCHCSSSGHTCYRSCDQEPSYSPSCGDKGGGTAYKPTLGLFRVSREVLYPGCNVANDRDFLEHTCAGSVASECSVEAIP